MATTFMPEQWTYRPIASVTILGKTVPVSSFSLTLTMSGIPKLMASIDPFHLVGATPQIAKAPGVDSFTATWRTLQAAIRNDEQRKVTFNFDARGTIDHQAFTLTDWLLTGAGFSDVRASGYFMMTIELVHPLFAFQESTPHLVGSAVQGEIPFEAVKGDDLLKSLSGAMRAYLSKFSKTSLGLEIAKDEDYIAGEKSMVLAYAKMISALENHLKWDPTWTGPKFPVAPFSTSLVDVIPYGLVEYVKSMNSAGSWDWFVHTFCAHWFLCIVPSFYKKELYLRPIEPWQAPKMTIYDTEVSKLDLPATDPMPVKGVMGIASMPSVEGPITWSAFQESQVQTTQEAMAHQEPSLTGSDLSLLLPSWIEGLLFYKAAKMAGLSAPTGDNILNVSFSVANNASDPTAGTLGTVYMEHTKALLKAAKVVARELFLENYRLHYQVSITSRLLIRSASSKLENNWVLPGYVMRLQADKNLPGSQGRPLLDFLVMQVVHSVDCMNRYASTQINGAYVHEAGEPNIKAIIKGIAPNVMYQLPTAS